MRLVSGFSVDTRGREEQHGVARLCAVGCSPGVRAWSLPVLWQGEGLRAPRGLSFPTAPIPAEASLWLAGRMFLLVLGHLTGPASRTALRLMYIFFLKCSLPFLELSLVFSLAHRS